VARRRGPRRVLDLRRSRARREVDRVGVLRARGRGARDRGTVFRRRRRAAALPRAGRRTAVNVVVSGRFAGVPHQGGTTWALLQYVLGLRRLGHDVLVVEPLPTTPDARVAECFRRVVEEFSLHDRAALLVDGGAGGMGSTPAEVLAFARRADVLINASGVLKDERILSAIPTRVYLDLDPAFTQLWHTFEGVDMGLNGHTHFVTVGLGIGRESTVPTCGRRWITSLPPVVLDRWPVARKTEHNAFTTVANWRAYGSVHHDGALYGQKAHSLRALIDLPDHTSETLLLALDIH